LEKLDSTAWTTQGTF